MLYTALCDEVWSEGLWFSPAIIVSSSNETDCHNITEMLLKVKLNAHRTDNIFTSSYLPLIELM
jgi:hypothetical protein